MRDSTSDVEVREGCCGWPAVAFEADRHSLERLTETEKVSVEPALLALVEGEQSLRGYVERQPASLVVSKAEMSAHLHSPAPSVALTPLALSPVFLSQANSLLCLLSLEEWWRARSKPSEEVTLGGRHLHGVTGFPIPVSEPDRVCADSPRFPKQELVRRVLKPPDRMAVRRPSNEVVDKFDFRRGFRRSPNRVLFASSPHVFSCRRTVLKISSY